MKLKNAILSTEVGKHDLRASYTMLTFPKDGSPPAASYAIDAHEAVKGGFYRFEPLTQEQCRQCGVGPDRFPGFSALPKELPKRGRPKLTADAKTANKPAIGGS